jgi:hypothetical protein
MKQLLTLFFALLFTIPAVANDRKAWQVSDIRDDGQQTNSSIIVFGNGLLRETYPGAITGADNFWDYQTNGSSLNSIYAFGDTIIVAYPAVDSLDPRGATTRVMYYLVSYDGGATWTLPLNATTLPNRSGYPDIATYIQNGGRNISLLGRRYNGANARGGAFAEAFLGLGSFSTSFAPWDGRDYFGYYQSGDLVAGVFSKPSGTGAATDPDTLKYARYNSATNTFENPTVIAVHGDGTIELNVRYRFVASDNGQTQFVMYWCPTPNAPIDSLDKMTAKVSTNSGTSWGSPITLQQSLTTNSIIGGDTAGPWFGMDAAFKPNTQEYAAVWSTMSPSIPTGGGLNTARNGGCKIMYWNPTVNGGTPTVVAGKNNMPQIADTALFFNRQALQVGLSPLSHPSIAYSQDGNMIVVAFSAFQPGDSLDGFTLNDIWTSYSTNNGATWSTPENRTQTPDWDELYPVLSPTGNASTKFHMKFQSTRGPGSQSFTDVVPTYRVYTVYRTFNPTTGIEINPIGTVVPSKFDLKQNYPNPFNPSTSIRFDLSKNSNVTLKVYNVLGKEVATLLNNDFVTAGTKEVSFDASNLSSGVYFYRLTAGSFTSTKKMILQK